MRSAVVIAVMLVGCQCTRPGSSENEETASPPVPIRMLSTHRGATAVWHTGDLWVSVAQDWERPSPIRLSRGDAPIHQELTGWVAGVHDGRVFVLQVGEDAVDVAAIEPDGHAQTMGTVPTLTSPYRYALAVTSTSEVVAATSVYEEIFVVGPQGTRRILGVVPDGDAVVSLVADPTSPRVALVLQQMRGTPTIDRPPRLVVVDTVSETTSIRDLAGSLSAVEGEIAYDTSGALWLHRDEGLRRFGEDAQQLYLPGLRIDARNMIFADDGSAIAYSEKHGGGHMALAGPGCTIHFVRTDATVNYVEPVLRFDTGCYFGRGLALVDGTLWIAPP